jgi:hypothetical protein
MTPFPGDGRRIEPVSLALVSQTTAECYAVCDGSDISQIIQHQRLRANVVLVVPAALCTTPFFLVEEPEESPGIFI